MTNKPTSKERELNQCPCCPATKCLMDEPCLGCETYAEWSAKPTSKEREAKTPKEIIQWCIWKHNNMMTGENSVSWIEKEMDRKVYPKALKEMNYYVRRKYAKEG